MADILLPAHLRQARTRFRYVDSTGVARSEYTGAVKTASKGGDRLAASIEFTKHGGSSTNELSNRAVMRSFLASLRGRQNRAYLYDQSYQRRGSMPTGEMLTNNTFANGTTGWNAGQEYTLTVADRELRATRFANSAASTILYNAVALSPVQYAPYCVRQMARTGRGPCSSYVFAGLSGFAADYGIASSSGLDALQSLAFVPYSGSSLVIGITDIGGGATIAGDYLSVPYLSTSRCALVDNAPNMLLQSDTFATAPWATFASTVTTNAAPVGPDGLPCDVLTETAVNSGHNISQSITYVAAAGDFAFTFVAQGGSRQWIFLQLSENIGGTTILSTFNVTTGALGATTTTGANWANLRRFITPLGNGWFACTIVGRKTNAATGGSALVALVNSDSNANYLGVGGSGVACWRAGLAQSSLPVRLAQTTSAATTGTTQAGSAMYTKGWPASTNGLLLTDDQFEVPTSRGSELKTLTARVDSDAAGLAYVQFVPPLRGTPADNAPIIVHQPMGRFLYTGDSVGWDNDPGFITTASIDLEEACT